MSLKTTIKQHTPLALLHVWRTIRWFGIERLKWNIDRRSWQSVMRIGAFKDIHRGKRCFIIGNGPSLRKTNLSLLRNEYTFGLNRIYLLFDELGFTTTYYVLVNTLVAEQFADDVNALAIPKFLSWRTRHVCLFDPYTTFIYSGISQPSFSDNPSRSLWEGATVTYVAMQIAYYMGFDQIILIGVDHNFTTKGTPHKAIVSQEDDPNHFSPHYFGKGIRWQLPDLETSERAYRLARETYRQDGREILDATIEGELQVFPKVDYESLFL